MRQRFEEAKSLLRKMMPVARRFLGASHHITLVMSWNYAVALYEGESSTLDDLRAAVATLEEIGPIARRVLGGAHPLTEGMEAELQNARAVLRARETPSTSA